MVTGPSKVIFVKAGEGKSDASYSSRPGPSGGKYVTEVINGKTYTTWVPANTTISAGSVRRGGAVELVNTNPEPAPSTTKAPPQTINIAISFSDIERAKQQFRAAGIENASDFFAAVERGDIDVRGSDIYFRTKTIEPVQVTRKEETNFYAPRQRGYGETMQKEPDTSKLDLPQSPIYGGLLGADNKTNFSQTPEGENPFNFHFRTSLAEAQSENGRGRETDALRGPITDLSEGLFGTLIAPVSDYFFTANKEGYIKASEEGVKSTVSGIYQVTTHPVETLETVGKEIFTKPFRAAGEGLGLYTSGKMGGKVVETVSPVKIRWVTDENLKNIGGPKTKGLQIEYPWLDFNTPLIGEVGPVERKVGKFTISDGTLEIKNEYFDPIPNLKMQTLEIKNPAYKRFLSTPDGKLYSALQEEGFEIEISSGGESPVSQMPKSDEGFSGGGSSPFENKGGLNALIGPGGSGQVAVLAEDTTFKVSLWKDATTKTEANLFLTGATSRFMPTPTGFVNELTSSGVIETTDYSKLGGVRSEVAPSVKIFENTRTSPIVNTGVSSRARSSIKSSQSNAVNTAVSVAQAQAIFQSQVQVSKLSSKLGLKSNTKAIVSFPKAKAQNKKGFDVYLRRKGVFKKLNSGALSKEQAFALGSYKAESTSAATFKILPSKGAVSSIYSGPSGSIANFYQKNGAYVEKPNKRINTQGEVREIPGKALFLTSFKPGRGANSPLGSGPTPRSRSKKLKKIFGVL